MDNKSELFIEVSSYQEGATLHTRTAILTYLPSLFCEPYVSGGPSEPPLTLSLTISAG